MRKIILSAIFITFIIPPAAFSYQSDVYVTPDSWSKHVNANGVKSSNGGGLDFGDSGILKIGSTTRVQLKASDETDWSIYEYIRLRLSGAKAWNGEINMNINVRGAYDKIPKYNSENNRTFSKYYDGIYTSRRRGEFDYRIYQANLELNKLIPITDISLGRIYLTQLNNYKIDGVNIFIDPAEYFKLNVYYGLPVSNYSNLKTQVAGASFAVPISQSGTQIRGEYSYFMHEDGGDLNTHAARLRVDQSLIIAELLSSTIYAEGAMVGQAYIYEIGFDANIDKSRSGLSAYLTGQSGNNDGSINPYVSMYEGMMASSEYIMGGFQFTQGITDYVMLGIGYEGRFNFTEAYGDRDYHRVFGNIDLIGLIHKNNYLSLIVDYYNVAAYGRQNAESKVLGGLRMTQVFTDKIEAWIGANVQNYQYRRSPIRMSGLNYGFEEINARRNNENTTLAYIGGQWRVTDWCVLQLDYTFEYADLFKSADLQPDVHTVELWVNFIW